ncbi:MAG: hypothetical protein RDU30_16760 [Desulfovibrionaceae bacterium]|nr:hypothetical protein [Desulfovibrionaceae bacterium]
MSHSALRITPVSSEADLDAFIRYPWTIYADDPLWVPPIIAHQKTFLDRTKGPFFEVGRAEYHLARRGDTVVGRISAHTNSAYEALHDPRTGFFGFFECENSQETADALFRAASAWLRAQGKTRLHGPLSFAIYDEVGLLVDGFDEMPSMMHTHNPRYYEDLILNFGFQKTFDWYAYKIDESQFELSAMKQRRDSILAKAGCRITHPPRHEFVRRAAEVRELFNDIWGKNWGHVPFTERQFADIFIQLEPVMRRDLLNVILENDEIVAFSVVAPDVNRSLHRFNGRLGPLNMLKLFFDCRVLPLEYCRAIIMGVKKTHQWRRLHHAIILQIIINFLENHPQMRYCDCSLIPESLVQWNKTLLAYGGKRYKTFRLYDRDI